ncbi:hypothetical protein [Wenyingzhuangia sp. IMCC45574]
MKLRTSVIKHPLGVDVRTPLLVPSYSSKGFAIHDGKSELCNTMEFAKEFIYESQLISAYDVYHNHMPNIDSINSTQITIIDSGGYETSNNFDLSETRKYDRGTKEWTQDLLEEFISNWTDLHPAIIVSYDNVDLKIPFKDQVHSAKIFFEDKKQFLSDFLIKPTNADSIFVDIDEIIENIELLEGFDIIGITEKELGGAFFERMKNIYILRAKLDEIGISSPIHIFGALDPLSVILYFIFGAEVFDGLSWLKYDYYNCCASYMNNSTVLKNFENIFVSDNEIRLESIKDNIYKLESLKELLIDFVREKKYNVFDDIGGEGFGNKIEKIVENVLKKI